MLLRDWLARAFPQAGAYARKKGFKPPVGAWIAARADTIAPLLVAHPALSGLLEPGRIRHAVANAERQSQPAWSLLFAALWHGHHVLGIDNSADIADTLRLAAGRT